MAAEARERRPAVWRSPVMSSGRAAQMPSHESHEQLTRLWQDLQPTVAAYGPMIDLPAFFTPWITVSSSLLGVATALFAARIRLRIAQQRRESEYLKRLADAEQVFANREAVPEFLRILREVFVFSSVVRIPVKPREVRALAEFYQKHNFSLDQIRRAWPNRKPILTEESPLEFELGRFDRLMIGVGLLYSLAAVVLACGLMWSFGAQTDPLELLARACGAILMFVLATVPQFALSSELATKSIVAAQNRENPRSGDAD